MSVDWDRSIDAWSAYWRSGQCASCTEGGGAPDTLLACWRSFFEALPQQARILDLGTGNGYVANIAYAVSEARGAGFDITGVDAAAIPKVAQTRSASADQAAPHLIGENRIEALPFRSSSFHAVTSQFGFEYAEQFDAIRELARVLKPQGVVRLAIHASEGAIFAAIRVRVDRLRLLVQKRGLISAIHYGAVARLHDDHDGEAIADLALDRIEADLAPLRRAAPEEDAALFYADGLMRLWRTRSRCAPTELLDSIKDARARIEAILLRQEALLSAAHSSDSIELLRKQMAHCGIEGDPAQPVRDDSGAQIAWLIDGRALAN